MRSWLDFDRVPPRFYSLDMSGQRHLVYWNEACTEFEVRVVPTIIGPLYVQFAC